MKAVTWIGVDIAKDSCVVAQRCPEGFQTEEFPITPKGLKALGNWLPQQPRLQIVLEATALTVVTLIGAVPSHRCSFSSMCWNVGPG